MRRKVVVNGMSGNVRRRTVVALDLPLHVTGGNWIPDALFTRRGWVECPPDPTGAAPDSGCPALPPPSF
jgi:hypothetical protein